MNTNTTTPATDRIDAARAALEDAEDAYAQAKKALAPAEVLYDLAQAVEDADYCYFKECELWEPDERDVSGAIGAGGLVYSDADPGL
jgi:hypothetical protein